MIKGWTYIILANTFTILGHYNPNDAKQIAVVAVIFAGMGAAEIFSNMFPTKG